MSELGHGVNLLIFMPIALTGSGVDRGGRACFVAKVQLEPFLLVEAISPELDLGCSFEA